jgi:hypothetical protein
VTWFRVDDGFPEHPKLAALEKQPRLWAESVSLWIAAGCYCAKHLTDGVVPKVKLKRMVPFNAQNAAKALVGSGLWEDTGEAYAFRNWLEYQPSRQRVESERGGARQRMASWRARNTTLDPTRYAVTSTERDEETEPVTDAVSYANPVPSRPVPTGENSEPSGSSSPQRATPDGEVAAKDWVAVLRTFDDAWEKRAGYRIGLEHSGHQTRAAAVYRWAVGVAYKRRTEWLEVVRKACDHAVADPFVARSKHPFSVFASSPGGYLVAQSAGSGMADPSPSSAFRDDSLEDIWGPEVADG